MSSTISSKGPGTGSRPNPTSQRRGLGMRLSVAAYRTARKTCLKNDGTTGKRKESCSSPGWTRTNNPPVNSRMLCQLSYRGSAAAIVASLREGSDLVPELRERLLELDETFAVGTGELPLQPALP